MADWKYDFRNGPDLSNVFAEETTFEGITRCVVNAAHVLCRHIRPADGCDGYRRVQYAVDVGTVAFDLVFNSEFGYRGAYFRSPHEGLAANAHPIHALLPKLRAHDPDSEGADCNFIGRSLSGQSAKVWLAEPASEVKECPRHGCVPEWRFDLLHNERTALISNGRWERSIYNHGAGRYGPHLSKLVVFGAFVNDAGDEWIPSRKVHRAMHLHEHGWA